MKTKQKLVSLLYFLTISVESKDTISVKNKKTQDNKINKLQKGNKVEQNKDGKTGIIFYDNYIIIKNTDVDDDFFDQIKNKPEVVIVIFQNCNIKTHLTRVGYTYVLYDSDFASEADRTKSRFIAIQNLDAERKERIFLFQNCNLDESIKDVYRLLMEKKEQYELAKVIKVLMKSVSFEDNDSIEETFNTLTSLHKISNFTDLEIKNPTFNGNQEVFRKKLQTLVIKTGINLTQERSAVISSVSSSGYGGNLGANSNMQRGDNEKSSGIKYSKSEVERHLQDINGIISDPAFVENILESYDYIKKNINSSDHQAKAKAFYYLSRIELLMKYPKNLKKTDFRSFRSTDYLKQIIRRLFQKEFPAGLTDFLQKLEDAVVFLVQAQDTSKLENLLLVGPAGIGKTSLSRIIAMIFALSVSTKSTISDELLDSSLVDDNSLEDLYNKLMTLSSYHIIEIKGSSISDINVITGVANTYTGAKAGIIGEMLAGKTLPLLIFVDEIDKVANYHGSSSKKGMDAIYTSLLNYLDKHGGRDTWIEGTLMMNGIWFVMTANTTDGINNTFLNRLNVVNLESPTAEEKKKIILRYLLKVLKVNGLVKNVNSYTVERNPSTGDIARYVIGGGKENKIKIVIDDKILASIISATQETDGLRAPLRYMDNLWTKLYLQIIENNTNKKPQEYVLDVSNIKQYINIENIDTEVIKGKNIIRCVYEASDGNHRFGHITVMMVKNRTGEVISIIGDDQNHGMLFSSLGKLINGMLSNLNILVDSQYYAKFGLGIIKMETLNLILTMPNDAVKSAYTSDLIATIMVLMISIIRKIPVKEGVVIAGQLASTGQFVKGAGSSEDKKDKIKYKNVIAAITNNSSLCNLLILPASAKLDREIQGYLKKLPSKIKVAYAANLGELLEHALDSGNIS